MSGRSAAVLLILLPAGFSGGTASGDFRFAILGDRTGEAQPGVYEQVWREVDAWRPGMVINVGDTIQGGDDAAASGEWLSLRPLFAKYRRYPLYFTPGNHDIWSETSRRVYERETRRPAHYGFDYGSAHFTVLDNSQTDALSDGEMQFLAADLEKSRNRAVKLVFFHRPFWLIPVMLRGDFPLHRLAVRYKVQYVVSGHAHKFARFEHGGVTYLMVGSSGGHLRGKGFEEGWFFHHVRVSVSGGKARMTIKEAGAPFGQGRSFTEDDWGSGPVMERKTAGSTTGSAGR
jgi:3',5'-cyclic-AMP phosphodiesterase